MKLLIVALALCTFNFTTFADEVKTEAKVEHEIKVFSGTLKKRTNEGKVAFYIQLSDGTAVHISRGVEEAKL